MSDQLDMMVQRLRAKLAPYFLSFDGTRDLGRGTAFPATADIPGGLQTSDRFFRTDLGWDCYYDGTRWLTQHEYTQPLIGSESSTAVASRSTTGFLQYGRIRTDYAPYITAVAVHTFVAGTNTAANYWTVRIQGVNATFTAGSDLRLFTTASDVVNTWTPHDGVDNATPSNRNFIVTQVAPTGAPGAITVLPTVYYRLIVP